MSTPTLDRRRAPRRDAAGPIRIRVESGQELEGALADASTDGFRARHPLRQICSGDVVEFAYQGRAGRARVIWTRIVDNEVESGFLVLKS
jgi:hypothetical protein